MAFLERYFPMCLSQDSVKLRYKAGNRYADHGVKDLKGWCVFRTDYLLLFNTRWRRVFTDKLDNASAKYFIVIKGQKRFLDWDYNWFE